ncbi:hypothetical protein SAMN02745194_00840 [Roseomonas rosea]|uniref:YfiR family protein n=1 Tax=Muricoccus roseus TaxID=198092 RepID=A0A1M6D724_9PROT|nr:YfiR/HmsC family protein [Roseomonas rosea]SHI68983.1 hypothetical protein SAMN02745194_00840 [Roseomonas rosea]
MLLSLTGALIGMPGPGLAEPTLRDLQAAVRALAFLEEPPTGLADIGIVYPDGSAEGLSQARRIAAIFGEGLRAGNLTLRPKLVTVAGAGQAGAVALLLTDAALPEVHRVAAAVARSGVVTIAAGTTAPEAGASVLSVRGGPRVEIVVNRAAAQAAGVSFAAAFRMMIQER